MKSITFTVQIQADFNERSHSKTSKTLQFCRDINEILAIYDGVTGGAQIISRPEILKVASVPED